MKRHRTLGDFLWNFLLQETSLSGLWDACTYPCQCTFWNHKLTTPQFFRVLNWSLQMGSLFFKAKRGKTKIWDLEKSELELRIEKEETDNWFEYSDFYDSIKAMKKGGRKRRKRMAMSRPEVSGRMTVATHWLWMEAINFQLSVISTMSYHKSHELIITVDISRRTRQQ